jgi:hypothetical protein
MKCDHSGVGKQDVFCGKCGQELRNPLAQIVIKKKIIKKYHGKKKEHIEGTKN